MLLTFHKTLCTATTLDPIIRFKQVSLLYEKIYKCVTMDTCYFEVSYWSLTFRIARLLQAKLGTVNASLYAFILAHTEYSYRILTW